jgi:hypothetical protein
MTFTFTAVVKATAAKFNFAACSRHAKCSFRVRHTKYITLIFYSGFIFCIIFMDITSIELIRTLICFIYNFRIPRRSGHILNSREPNESYCGKNLEPLQSMHCWSSALSAYMSNLCSGVGRYLPEHYKFQEY